MDGEKESESYARKPPVPKVENYWYDGLDIKVEPSLFLLWLTGSGKPSMGKTRSKLEWFQLVLPRLPPPKSWKCLGKSSSPVLSWNCRSSDPELE